MNRKSSYSWKPFVGCAHTNRCGEGISKMETSMLLGEQHGLEKEGVIVYEHTNHPSNIKLDPLEFCGQFSIKLD
jgi:hypothetical protein